MSKPKKNLIGLRFGKLVVLEEAEPYRDSSGKIKSARWLCICDCGNKTIAYPGSLIQGEKLSCGCLVNEKRINLIGKNFGNLVVIKEAKKKDNHRRWICKCGCGKYTIKNQESLTRGQSYSCGCLYHKGKHHKRNTRLYTIWDSMKQRCGNPNNSHFYNYGGRGITVCDEWNNSKDGFENFYNWSIKNGYKDSLTLDRIDVNGNYEPRNCRWITNHEQQFNKRTSRMLTLNGKTQCVTQWAKELNIKESTIRTRLYNGWDDEKALTTPVKERRTSYESNNS